ncbi:MAG: hypothetical protein IJU91_05065 [Selenomonadaceae bacterium]|nr:hypothetical protein [Selenomonadaceae bacterium]
MNELFYTAPDLACIIDNWDLTVNDSSDLIQKIFQQDKNFLADEYRNDYRKLFLDVRYWSDYLCDKVTFDKEFPAIQKDCGGVLDDTNFVNDDFDLDLFFKSLRIKLLYIGEKKYVRMKLRTLLSVYGYKRRSKEFIFYLKDCLKFYHIQTSLRGKICDVAEINLDDMITFRVV